MPGRTLLFALALTLLAIPGLLRFKLDVDLVAVLPESSPVAEAYRQSLELFGGVEKVFVLLTDTSPSLDEGGSDEAGDRLLGASEALEVILGASPLVHEVRSGLQPTEESFFLEQVLPRAALLRDPADIPDLEAMWTQTALRERAQRMRAALLGPAGALEAQMMRVDPLGLAGDLPRDAAGIGASVDPLTGAFVSTDGRHGLLVITPTSRDLDPAAGRALLDLIADAARNLDVPHLEVDAVGGPIYAAHDETIIREDVSRTASGSLILCALLLLLSFGTWRPALATVLSLATALAWGGAVIGYFHGPVSAIGIAFAAVLVGLGVDYGIHGGARFRDARVAGDSPTGALVFAWRESGAAIATSALTTGAAFGILGFAHFRPLRELGTVVALGILGVLVATGVVGGSLLVLGQVGASETRLPLRSGPLWPALGRVARTLSGTATRAPRRTLAVSGALTILALIGLPRLELDTDLRRLRPVDHPALEVESALIDAFDLGLDVSTLVVPAASPGEALEKSREVAAILRAAHPELPVLTAGDWLTEGTRERAAAWRDVGLAEAVRDFREELRATGLDPRGFATGLEALEGIANGTDPGLPPLETWPAGMRELLRSDAAGTWAALRVRLPIGVWRDGLPPDVEAAIQQAAPGTTWSSVPALGTELRTLALGDLRRLGGLALVTIIGVVLLSFRGRPLPTVAALVPVLLGSTWAFGFWGLLGGRIDMMGLAVLPIILGIGIDDGLHAVHGVKEHGSIAASLAAAGRAMTLTTATTGIGFASLVLSRVPGLRSGGLLVTFGVLACWVATLTILPALAAATRSTDTEASRR